MIPKTAWGHIGGGLALQSLGEHHSDRAVVKYNKRLHKVLKLNEKYKILTPSEKTSMSHISLRAFSNELQKIASEVFIPS